MLFFKKMICSIAFYYRPFNLLSPSVTEDKSKTVRYFKLWSALHLKFELQLRIIGLRPTIVAIPRHVTKLSSARGVWILPNSKIGQNPVQGKEALQSHSACEQSQKQWIPISSAPSRAGHVQPSLFPMQILVSPVQLSNPFPAENIVFSDLSLLSVPSLIPRSTLKLFVALAVFPFPRKDLLHLPRKMQQIPLPILQPHWSPCWGLTLLIKAAEGIVPTSDVTFQSFPVSAISFPASSETVRTLSSRRSWLCPIRNVLKRLSYAKKKKLANQCFLKDSFTVTLQKDSAWLFLSLLNIEIVPKEKYSKGQTHQKSKFFIDCNKPNPYSKSPTVHLPSSPQWINQCYSAQWKGEKDTPHFIWNILPILHFIFLLLFSD